MQSVNTDTARKGSAPALANPTKSITKIQESLAQYFKKWIRVKTDPCKVSAIRVSFFDLWPCRRPGTQRQHGKLYLWQYSVHTPSAMDKNLNTDFTENTDLAFSLIFLVGKCFLDFYQDFRGFASAWALPFLCWLQSLSFSNLSWPSQREGISYSTLSKTSSANYFSQSL